MSISWLDTCNNSCWLFCTKFNICLTTLDGSNASCINCGVGAILIDGHVRVFLPDASYGILILGA